MSKLLNSEKLRSRSPGHSMCSKVSLGIETVPTVGFTVFFLLDCIRAT